MSRSDALGAPEPTVRRLWGGVTLLIATAVFAEAVFAGAMMSGAPWARGVHRLEALMLVVLTAAAGLLALATLRRAQHGLRLALTLFGLAALLAVQMALGAASAHGANLLWLHVPLGVGVVGVAIQSAGAARKLG